MTFQDWLIAERKSSKTIKHYTGAIDGRLKTLAAHLDKGDFTLSDIKTSSLFANVCQKFDQSQEIFALNIRGKDMYRRALVLYGQFKYSVDNEAAVLMQTFEESVHEALQDSVERRRERLANATSRPRKKVVSTVVYIRNPDVVAEVLLRAKGICEGCKNQAPFLRKSDHSPYLEVHHRTPLALGGEDTVTNAIALCPNCHREHHFG